MTLASVRAPALHDPPASRPSDVDDVVEAERLGFTHCWMADSQMTWSDVYVPTQVMPLLA